MDTWMVELFFASPDFVCKALLGEAAKYVYAMAYTQKSVIWTGAH